MASLLPGEHPPLGQLAMHEGYLPGCLLLRDDVYIGLVKHYGVMMSQSPIVIAHIDKSAEGKLRVKLESFETFAAGREVRYLPVTTPVALELMRQRIDDVERKGPPFGLLEIGQAWNCESFARYISTGTPCSTQADAAKGLGAVALFVAAAWAIAASAEQDNAQRGALRRASALLSPLPDLPELPDLPDLPELPALPPLPAGPRTSVAQPRPTRHRASSTSETTAKVRKRAPTATLKKVSTAMKMEAPGVCSDHVP